VLDRVEGSKKIQAIKAIRAATGLSLRDTKHLVDVAERERTSVPLGHFTGEVAVQLQAELLATGAVVTLVTLTTEGHAGLAAPLAAIGQLIVFPDRVITPEGTRYDLSPSTNASVEATGSTEVTRGRNLAAKAAGGLLIPGGVFLFGNARERAHDYRELFIVIEDPSWHYTIAVHPNLGLQARDFVAALRSAASALAADATSIDGGDAITALERLANLRDRGVLSDAEFEEQKQRVLNAH
jgi:hypothetical protein